ncbi:MAG: glycosyltransferase family A protein [Gemmatimonadaceae bacterium]
MPSLTSVRPSSGARIAGRSLRPTPLGHEPSRVISISLLALAALSCAAAVIALADIVLGARHIPVLIEQPLQAGRGGRVSVVIAARDEERNIEAALRSVLSQTYDDYEVIVVDDRSADATGAILDRMRETWPRLRVVHVTELPPGWLGKNHAMQVGAEAADGEMLLFSDADIVLDPTTLSRAVRYMNDNGVDHITAGPGLVLPSLPLALVVNFFTISLLLYMRPYRARVPGTRWHIGIGAFNLVRVSSYRRAGTHRRIAMRPDDDLKLGKILKESGASQHLLDGRGALTVEWYRTLGELVRGFRKNAFAALEYRLWVVTGAVVVSLALNVWPFVAIAVTSGATRALNAATALVAMTLYALVARSLRQHPWLALFYPVAALIFLYIVVAATLRTVFAGGIEWRGTRYSLRALRANKV